MKLSTLFAKHAVERVSAPPELESNEHVLWEHPPGAPNKRLTFQVHGENNFGLKIYTRLDAVGDIEPGLTRAQLREIIARIVSLAKL